MTECYFTNLKNITCSELMKARKKIRIAVAWINFEQYADILLQLNDKGVKIKILINEDNNNHRQDEIIAALNEKGIKIRLVKFSGIMHHKFCIVDEKICLFGSFNWTDSANLRNIEDLNICDEPSLIFKYILEFRALWELSKTDIKLLRNPEKCPNCKSNIINILLMNEDGYHTKLETLHKCDCGQSISEPEFYDISLYNNYLEQNEYYLGEIEKAEEYNDSAWYNRAVAELDYMNSVYFTFVRKARMGNDIIHAIGVPSWKWISKHDGEYVYKIIWKERGMEELIPDEIPME